MPVEHVLHVPSSLSLFTVHVMKFLGVTFIQKLSWNPHVYNVCNQAGSRLYVLRRMRTILKREELTLVYSFCIRSVFEYNSEVFIGLTEITRPR